jgi:hypothetical protein
MKHFDEDDIELPEEDEEDLDDFDLDFDGEEDK